jgi:hypothetical protein
MIRNQVFLILVLLEFCYRSNAQVLKPVPIYYSVETVTNQKAVFLNPYISGEKLFYIETKVMPYSLQYTPSADFSCTLPKGAIFCRLEDAIYNHLNFWVKFRMGTDDRYSN